MIKSKGTNVLLVLMFFIFLNNILAAEKKEIKKNFKNKKLVRIQTISGDCVIKKGKVDNISVYLTYTYDDESFKPEFNEEENTLVLRERYFGSSSGSSHWEITVPAKTFIKARSVSGNLSINGLNGQIDGKTISGEVAVTDCEGEIQLKSISGDMELQNLKGDIGLKATSSEIKIEMLNGVIQVVCVSGDIEAKQVEGDISLKVVSGDIQIKNSKGKFKLRSVSGNIDSSNLLITSESLFKVVSGDVEIILAKSTGYNLTLASTSGDAELNYNGNPIKGFFEFTAKMDDGRIISPFKFEKEDILEKWGQKYEVKSFKRDGDTPKIKIKTATGKAILKK